MPLTGKSLTSIMLLTSVLALTACGTNVEQLEIKTAAMDTVVNKLSPEKQKKINTVIEQHRRIQNAAGHTDAYYLTIPLKKLSALAECDGKISLIYHSDKSATSFSCTPDM